MGYLYMSGALSLPQGLATSPLHQDCAHDVPHIFLAVQEPELPPVVLQPLLNMVRLFRQLQVLVLLLPSTRTRLM